MPPIRVATTISGCRLHLTWISIYATYTGGCLYFGNSKPFIYISIYATHTGGYHFRHLKQCVNQYFNICHPYGWLLMQNDLNVLTITFQYMPKYIFIYVYIYVYSYICVNTSKYSQIYWTQFIVVVYCKYSDDICIYLRIFVYIQF